ncbi:MAG: hypothetical protein ACD_62C00117G0002, partial [uncultured bacterium]
SPRSAKAIARDDTPCPQILRYPHAIPQLLPGHTRVIDKLITLTKTLPGLTLASNDLTGVGSEHVRPTPYAFVHIVITTSSYP